jgi:hypothetical protein
MNEVATKISTTIDHFIELTNSQVIDWEHKPSPDKWSNKEVIGHLCDSAHVNLQRFVRCTYEENFKLVYQQEEWVAAQHYQDMDVTDLLQLWRLLNLQIVRVLDSYPADRWQAKCDTNKKEVIYRTIEWLSNDYVDHIQHHLNQIRFN